MKYLIKRYDIYPSVVPAGKPVRLYVLASENAFLFFEDKTYTVRINALDADMQDYHDSSHKTQLEITARGGILQFDFSFETEGEYWVDILLDNKVLQPLKVYALKENLYTRRPLKGDFHAHSYRSDGKHDPAALAGYYRECGYDFMTMTDHNRYFPSDELRDWYSAVQTGLTVIKGEEVHTPGSCVHIVHAGGGASVADIYFRDSARYEKEYSEIQKNLPDSIPERYRERYAMAKWASDSIHKVGGLAIFAHPYWRPESAKCYNVCDDLSRLLLKSGMFDAYELVGGMECDGINMSVALFNDLRAEGLKLATVGSSDVHSLETNDFAYHFTIVFARDNTSDNIIDAVREGCCIAVEMSETARGREYRCYGSLRFVKYAQFLLNRYFRETELIAAGEGVAMRRYAVGMESARVVTEMARRVDGFYEIFFGRKPPVLPSDTVLEQENKWRGFQLDSPPTRGSSIKPREDNKRNI